MTNKTINQDLEEVIRWVYVRNLIPEELVNSRLPDKYLSTIAVRFKSIAQRNYFAFHIPEHPDGPYILLASKEHKDTLDIAAVHSQLGILANGRPESFLPLDRGNDLCYVLKLCHKPTQESIAKLVNKYKTIFTEVTLHSMSFDNVPVSELPNLNLPLERLELKDKYGNNIIISELKGGEQK